MFVHFGEKLEFPREKIIMSASEIGQAICSKPHEGSHGINRTLIKVVLNKAPLFPAFVIA